MTTICSEESRAQLKRLIDFLRAEGVVAFSSGDLTLSLLPAEARVEEVVQEKREVATERQKKKDGLTEEEQVELYGRPMS